MAAPATVSSEPAPIATGSDDPGRRRRPSAVSQETCRARIFSNGRRRGGSGASHARLSDASQPRLPQSSMMTDATLFVCVTCKHAEEESVRPGMALFEALRTRLDGEDKVALRAVECLSVCKRPCTIALSGPGKWTYVVGNLDIAENAGDIVDAALKFAATSDGLIPWRERPLSFRRGVISRTPPLSQPLEEA
jgi:predicted metal-binding protein